MKKSFLLVFCILSISGSLQAEGERISLKAIQNAWATKTEPQITQFVERNKGKSMTVVGVVFKAETKDAGGGTVWFTNQNNDVIEVETDSETALALNKGYAYTIKGKFADMLDTDPNRHPVIYSIVKFVLDNRSTHLVIGISDAEFSGGHAEGLVSKSKCTAKGWWSAAKDLINR